MRNRGIDRDDRELGPEGAGPHPLPLLLRADSGQAPRDRRSVGVLASDGVGGRWFGRERDVIGAARLAAERR